MIWWSDLEPAPPGTQQSCSIARNALSHCFHAEVFSGNRIGHFLKKARILMMRTMMHLSRKAPHSKVAHALSSPQPKEGARELNIISSVRCYFPSHVPLHRHFLLFVVCFALLGSVLLLRLRFAWPFSDATISSSLARCCGVAT